MEDFQAERQKFMREKEVWENDKKKLQQELEVEKLVAKEKENMQHEIDREKEKMKREREDWEREKIRMEEELSAARVYAGEAQSTTPGVQVEDETAARTFPIDDIGDDASATESNLAEEELAFRSELKEGVRRLEDNWDDLDLNGKWEGLQDLELYDQASIDEVNALFEQIEDRELEADVVQAEKLEILDQLFEQAQLEPAPSEWSPEGENRDGGGSDGQVEMDWDDVRRTEELIYELRQQWDDLDAEKRWEGLLALEVMLDEDLEDINDVLEEIDGNNKDDQDAAHTEKCDVLDNILEQLEENVLTALNDYEQNQNDNDLERDDDDFTQRDIENVRRRWTEMVDENCEPANRQNMLQAFEEMPDNQKYAMLLEWSSYFRRPGKTDFEVEGSSSNADTEWKYGRNPTKKDPFSDALKYSVMFFAVFVMLCILFMVLFPDLWNRLTDMANGGIG